MTRRPSTVVLVEGPSDKAAVETLISQGGYDSRQLSVVSMGGATNVSRHLRDATRRGQRIAGLVDAGEEAHLANALEQVGLGSPQARTDLAALGFFVCDPDLEGELIRAMGTDRILGIVADQPEDLRRFRSLQGQPEWRDRPVDEQLRRWFGSGGGRKVRYASLLTGAIPEAALPAPLSQLLVYASGLPR